MNHKSTARKNFNGTFMLLKCIVILGLLLVQASYCKAQSADSIFSCLKVKYSSINNFKESLIFVKVSIKNRYHSDTSSNQSLFWIKKVPHAPRGVVFNNMASRLYKSGSLHGNLFKMRYLRKSGLNILVADKDALYHLKGVNAYMSYDEVKDTLLPWGVNLVTDLKRQKFPYMYWMLNDVPNIRSGWFKTKAYGKPILVRNAGDTIILKQWNKSMKANRYLYINKKMEIFKIEEIFTDVNDLNQYHCIDISMHDTSAFDELMKANYFYKYKKKFVKREEPESDTLGPGSKKLCLLDNKILTLNDSSKIKYILFDYWYISCIPCYKMRPLMKEIEHKTDTFKIRFVEVNPSDKLKDLQFFLAQKNIVSTQLDCSKNIPPFSINTFPTMILVDSNFRFIKKWVGYSNENQKQIEDYLNKLGLIIR